MHFINTKLSSFLFMAAAVCGSPANLGRRDHGHSPHSPISIHGTGTGSIHPGTGTGTRGHHPTPTPTTCTKTTSITVTYTLGSGPTASVVTTTAVRTYTEIDYIVSRALIPVTDITNSPSNISSNRLRLLPMRVPLRRHLPIPIPPSLQTLGALRPRPSHRPLPSPKPLRSTPSVCPPMGPAVPLLLDVDHPSP
jgi:hypothetical protein